MISFRFQGQAFNIRVKQVYTLITDAEEVEVDLFCKDLQHFLEITPKKYIFFIIRDWNTKVESQDMTGIMGKISLRVQNEAGQRQTDFCQESMLVIANTQEMSLHMDITRWATLK